MHSATARLCSLVFSLPIKLGTELWPVNFDKLVQNHFAPIARRGMFSMRKLAKGVHEIGGRDFAIRVREGTGHSRDFLITLVPGESRINEPDDLANEIGLGVIAEFFGEPLVKRDMFTPGRFKRGFAEAAASAEKFLIPYLSGERRDLDEIRRFIEGKVEASGVRKKQYRFRPNVREEWL
ncbi:MAG TPA: hypothetical protein VG734_18305 [Lacunisphaera sp.]|nr:hypothetical protein [Lacunisphaera sp.]